MTARAAPAVPLLAARGLIDSIEALEGALEHYAHRA